MRLRWLFALLGIMGLCASAAAPELRRSFYHVVRIKDHEKQDEHKVMTAEEFKALQKELQEEAKLFPRALDKARVEWSKDETLKGKYFPRTALAPRKADLVGQPYTEEQKAQKKLNTIFEYQAERERRDAEEDRRRQQQMNRVRHVEGRTIRPAAADTRRQDAEQEQKELRRRAAELVSAEIVRIREALSPGGGAAAAAAKPAEEEAAGKQDIVLPGIRPAQR